MFTKETQDNLARYLLGLYCDKNRLAADLRNMHKQVDIAYSEYIFRGMCFSRVIDKTEIHSENICSWTTDIEIAEQVASHGRYPVILVKKSKGYSVQKVLQYLKDNNQMYSEQLAKCSSKYEREVLDSLNVYECSVLTTI